MRIYILLISNSNFLQEINSFDDNLWKEKLKDFTFFQSVEVVPHLATNPFVFSLMGKSLSHLILVYNDYKSIIGLCIIAINLNGKKVISAVIPGSKANFTNLLAIIEDNGIKLQSTLLSYKDKKTIYQRLTKKK